MVSTWIAAGFGDLILQRRLVLGMLMFLWCLFTWSSNPLGEQAAASVRQQPRFSSRQPHEVSGFFTNSADTGLAKPEVSQMSDSGSDSAPSRAPWSSQGIFPRRGNAAFLRPEFLLLCSLDPEQAVKSNQSALCLFKSNRSYAVWDFLAKWIFFFFQPITIVSSWFLPVVQLKT